MYKENVAPIGSLELILSKDGIVKEKITVENLVVTTGLAYLAARSRDAAMSVMSHMALGTDATAPVLADNALKAELSRVALTSVTSATTNVTNDSTLYSATFGAGIGTGAIVEAGIFNAGTSGTMLSRTTFAVLNKAASDVLTINWKIVMT